MPTAKALSVVVVNRVTGRRVRVGTGNLISRVFTVVMRSRPPTMAAARWRNGRRRGDGAPSQTLVQFQAGPPTSLTTRHRCKGTLKASQPRVGRAANQTH